MSANQDLPVFDWLTAEQAAERLGVSRATFYRWLPGLKREGVVVVESKRGMFIEPASLDTWRAKGKQRPEPEHAPKPRGRKPSRYASRHRKDGKQT